MSVSQIDDTSKRDARSIFNFLERVYRWQPTGWVFFAIKDRGGRWRELQPIDTRKDDDRRHLRMIIDKFSHDYDFYFCPTVFSTDIREKEYALYTCWLHCDIDGGNPNDFAQRPSVMWETSPERYQALWMLPESISPSDAEACNRALAQHSEDGTGWEINKYLRVPLTFNFKPDYHRPRVRLLKADFEPLMGWKPERRTAATGGGDIDWSDVDALDAREVASEYSVSSLMRSKVYRDRSGWLYRIASDMSERGASANKIACVLWNSKAASSRRDDYGDDAVRQDIERICAKKGK